MVDDYPGPSNPSALRSTAGPPWPGPRDAREVDAQFSGMARPSHPIGRGCRRKKTGMSRIGIMETRIDITEGNPR